MENKTVIDTHVPSNATDLHELKIDGQTVIESCNHNEAYHHQIRNNLSYPNVDIHAGHINAHGVYSKHITAGTMKAGVLDIGEYQVNGKLLADKNRNIHASSLTLSNNVSLTTDQNQNFFINGVNMSDNIAQPFNVNYKDIDDKNFCKNWNMPMDEYNVVGYIVSKNDTGKYQTIIDSAGYVYTSDLYGRIWEERIRLTNNSQLVCLSASDTCQNQMCVDKNGMVYLSSNYGKSWQSKFLGNVVNYNLSSNNVDNICCSISNSGKFQIVCYGTTQYTSDDYGNTFVDISMGTGTEFKFISVKDLGDYYYNLLPPVIGPTPPDNLPQDAMVLSVSTQARIFLSSYDHSGGWITFSNGKKFSQIGNEIPDSSGQTLSSFAISDNLEYNTLCTNMGYTFRSDTSGGLINNVTYKTNNGIYLWESPVSGNSANGNNIKSIAMNSSGSFQIFTTDNGYIYYGSSIVPNLNNAWTISKVSELPLKFINVSNNGSQLFLYMIDEAGVIFMSADRGTSWKSLTNNVVLKSIACSKSGKYINILDTSGYICTSSNYGKIWGVPSRNAQGSMINSALTNGEFHQIVISDDGQYSYAIDDFKIYRSVNYGKTWTRFSTDTFEAVDSSGGSPPIYPLRSISVSGDGNTLAVIDSNYMEANILTNSVVLYLFTNIKETNAQTPQKIIIDTDDFITSLTSVSLSYDGNYISVVSPNRNYISSDRGLTWKSYINTPSIEQIPRTVISSDGKVVSTIMADSKTINVMNTNGNIRSYQVDPYSSDGLLTGLAMSETGQYVIACDNSGNIFRSNNTNVHVDSSHILDTVLSSNTMIVGVAMSGDGKYQFAIDSDNHFYMSNSFGQYGTFYSTRELSSRNIFLNTLITCSDISENGKVITIADLFGNCIVSHDYGKTFMTSRIASGYSTLDVKLSSIGQIQYAICDDNVNDKILVKSTDFGISWNACYYTASEIRYLVISHDGKYVTIGDRSGQVHVSKDFGTSFNTKSVVGHTVSAETVVKMSGCGKYQYVMLPTAIYRSQDHGELWELLYSPIGPSVTPMMPITITPFTNFAVSKSGQHQTYITETGQILISSNFGNTIKYNTILSNDGQITTYSPSVTMSGNGKYQCVIIGNISGSTSTTCSLTLFMSVNCGVSWKEANFFPLAFSIPEAMVYGVSPRFTLSNDAQYGIFTTVNQILLTNVSEISQEIMSSNLVVNNNAIINNLSVCGFINNGSYMAKVTKIINNYASTLAYNQLSSDYVIVCSPIVGNVEVYLRDDTPLGQIIIITKTVSTYTTVVYTKLGGFIGSNDTYITLYGAGSSSITAMSLGDGNWSLISSVGMVA